MSKITFDRNSGHFRSIQNFFIGGHFGCLKITFDRISAHADLSAILDVPNSLSMAFLAISDPCAHFGCPQITFDRISGHFGWNDNVNYRTRPRYLDE